MKGVKITLGGQERTLRYDLNAIALLGQELGLKVRLAYFREDVLETPLPLSALRTLLWVGLLHAEPELTEQQVGGWVDHENLAEVLAAFFELFSSASEDTQRDVAAKLGLDETGTGSSKDKTETASLTA